MKSLEEIKSFAAYLGDCVDIEKLTDIASEVENTDSKYPDCKEYIFSNQYLNSRSDAATQFKVISSLLNYWKAQNIVFEVHLFLQDQILIGGQMHKIKMIPMSNVEYEMEPSLQEIRVARRVLDYIAKEK